MVACGICGSKFGNKECYFCLRRICGSCVVPADVSGNSSTTKCMRCDRMKINKISFYSVLKRNKLILGIIIGFWIFTVYPIPFLHVMGYNVDTSALQPVLIATAIMTIPFVFMFIAWQRTAPKSSREPQK
jgi:hypothetical protein